MVSTQAVAVVGLMLYLFSFFFFISPVPTLGKRLKFVQKTAFADLFTSPLCNTKRGRLVVVIGYNSFSRFTFTTLCVVPFVR